MYRNNKKICWFAVGLYSCVPCYLVMFGILAQGIFAQFDRSKLPHIKWTAESVEYAALCSQAWRVGWERIVAYRFEHPGKRFLVGMDVDEVVLFNVQYNIEHEKYEDETWFEWGKSMRSIIVPGAQEFLAKAHAMPEIQLVFISRRWEKEREWTEKLMRDKGLLKGGDILLMRRSKEDTKENHRREIVQKTGLEIAVLFGDQISDFYEIKGKDQAIKDRQNAATDPRWGRKFIIFPNPVYGAWERDYQ